MPDTADVVPMNDRWRRFRRPRWFELAPEVIVGVGLLVFLVDETDAATSSFESGRAIALMAFGTVAWLVTRALAARFVPWSGVRVAAFALAGAAVLAVVVLPAYDDDTVVETLPAASPSGPSAAAPPGPSSAPETPAAASPTRLRTGSFRGVDHRAAGTVAIYRQVDGRLVIGLEDIDIQPGPDYDVYVVPGANREDRGGGTRIDDLRGNKGTQYYDVPAALDLTRGPWTVLVWCHTFAVPIATATPA